MKKKTKHRDMYQWDKVGRKLHGPYCHGYNLHNIDWEGQWKQLDGWAN